MSCSTWVPGISLFLTASCFLWTCFVFSSYISFLLEKSCKMVSKMCPFFWQLFLSLSLIWWFSLVLSCFFPSFLFLGFILSDALFLQEIGHSIHVRHVLQSDSSHTTSLIILLLQFCSCSCCSGFNWNEGSVELQKDLLSLFVLLSVLFSLPFSCSFWWWKVYASFSDWKTRPLNSVRHTFYLEFILVLMLFFSLVW